MKILLLFLLTCSTVEIKGQDIAKSEFYDSFYTHLGLSNYTAYKDRVGLYSIRMKTNKDGIITEYETSASVDSILRGDIDRAFKSVNRAGLKSFGVKKSVLILPLIIINGVLSPIDSRMWEFENGHQNKKTSPRLLPPIVVFLGFNKMIKN